MTKEILDPKLTKPRLDTLYNELNALDAKMKQLKLDYETYDKQETALVDEHGAIQKSRQALWDQVSKNNKLFSDKEQKSRELEAKLTEQKDVIDSFKTYTKEYQALYDIDTVEIGGIAE